jgi:LCP family protein required for cell wall assembly
MVVNPKDHAILLVSIPRDYYLTIPGTGGAKDKLTHTGTIGGVETTIATIEENFGIKIQYYVRVNFNFVQNLVDSIGGIDIYNDQSYSFTCWTDRGCTFYPGWNNNVDGRCALAFARERYSYDSGDRHRGENQQHVIDQIKNKVTTSPTILSNYSGILNSLAGTFETNMSNEELTSLIKMQVKDMSGWDLGKYQVNGNGTSAYTYSYPNQQLYVMIPDENTMTEAVARINAVLGTESD